jgi:RNA polymerase sigma factor for flagellar operon FliA
MTLPFEEILKKNTHKIRCLAARLSGGRGGIQQVDELAAAGNLALWYCYRRFDTRRLQEDDFWMFAQRRVCGAMLDTLRKQDSIGRSGRKLALGGKLEKVPWAATQAVSLTEAAHLPSPSDPQRDLLDKCDCELARALVAGLSDRHRQVIHMYFVEEMTLAAIGKRLKISEGRVSQLRKRALALMRALVEKHS